MTCNKTILFVGVLMTYFVDDPRSGSRCVRVVLCEAASAASAASNDEQSDDSLLSEIASAQAEVGDVDGAMSTTDKIGDLEQRGSTLFSVSVAALAVNFAEARRVADRIKPEYDLYGNDYRASAYSRMGEAEAERGNLQEARDIAEAIKQGWGPKQAYFVLWEVATFQWRAGHEQESLRTLEEIGADAEDKIRVIVSAALREAEVGENQRAGNSAFVARAFSTLNARVYFVYFAVTFLVCFQPSV